MNDISYLDPEQNNTSSNEKLDYKFILMRQIDKVRLSRSTEMRGGYWETRPLALGGGFTETQVWITDTKDVYISSVKALKSLLIVYYDPEYIKKFNGIVVKVEKIKDKDSEELVEIYDLILEELLQLCLRKKLIGGNLTISDELNANFEIPENGKNKS